MGKINLIRKRIIKREMKKGKDAKASMIKAGYSNLTAHNATATKVVKACQEEIGREFDIAEITPKNIIGRIDLIVQKALETRDLSNALRGLETIGKWLKMFQDSGQGNITINLSDLHSEILKKSGFNEENHTISSIPSKDKEEE